MILDLNQKQKRLFNANSKEDLLAYKTFLQKGWGKNCCPFILEFPHEAVPHMIQDKIIHNVILGVKNDKGSY
jgi:hypothetical protein